MTKSIKFKTFDSPHDFASHILRTRQVTTHSSLELIYKEKKSSSILEWPPLLTRRDKKVDLIGSESIRFCRLGLLGAVDLFKLDRIEDLGVGFTDFSAGWEVFE